MKERLGGSGLSLVLGVMAGLVLACGPSAEELRLEEEAVKAQAAALEIERVEARRVEFGEGPALELEAAMARAQDALLARDVELAETAREEAIAVLEPFRPDLDADADVILAVERLAALRKDIKHAGRVAEGLALSKEVVNDAEKCTTPVDIEAAWKMLKTTVPADPEWKEAQRYAPRLERCRVKAEKSLTKTLQDLMMAQRVAMPATMEGVFLDNGMDVRISLSGSRKTTIKYSWVLFSRVSVHQLTDGGAMGPGSFLRNLQDAGFKKVIFSDKYSESWTYDLKPEDDSGGGVMVLEEFGLHEPLVLKAPESE